MLLIGWEAESVLWAVPRRSRLGPGPGDRAETRPGRACGRAAPDRTEARGEVGGPVRTAPEQTAHAVKTSDARGQGACWVICASEESEGEGEGGKGRKEGGCGTKECQFWAETERLTAHSRGTRTTARSCLPTLAPSSPRPRSKGPTALETAAPAAGSRKKAGVTHQSILAGSCVLLGSASFHGSA